MTTLQWEKIARRKLSLLAGT